jgi:ABC-2 type transport system permease protein
MTASTRLTGSARSARIVDRGYRKYSGERRGARGAMRSLIVQTIQRALGIHRSFWAKLWPIAVIAMAYIPAIVFIGITVITKNLPGGTLRYQALLPSYGQYYGFITAAILIFVAFVAPEVLCTDRKNRMLGLYLSSPLTRTTYLVSKAIAVAIVLSFVTLGPALLMVIAFALNGYGPNGFGAFLELLGRAILGGLVIASLQTMLSLAISSTTTRKWAATAATIVVLLGTGFVTDLIITEGNGSRSYFLLNLAQMPYELVLRIYADGTHSPRYARTIDTPALVAAYVGWTVLFGAFVWWRYQRIEVTR